MLAAKSCAHASCARKLAPLCPTVAVSKALLHLPSTTSAVSCNAQHRWERIKMRSSSGDIVKHSGGSQPDKSSDSSTPHITLEAGTGLALLLLANTGVFYLVLATKAKAIAALAFVSATPAWWQFVTSVFCHATIEQLARNMAMVLLFGKLLERELGGPGIWFTYVVCGLGANLSAWMLLPAKLKATGAMMGLAATGGAFGLFVVAVVLSFRLSFGWVVATAIAAQFVLHSLILTPVPGLLSTKLMAPTGLQAILSIFSGAGLAWVWGALAGAAIALVLARLPLPEDGNQVTRA